LTCCSYAHRIDAGLGEEFCVFVMCQKSCGSWDLIVGQCDPVPVISEPGDQPL
jgi:hypothetical protein